MLFFLKWGRFDWFNAERLQVKVTKENRVHVFIDPTVDDADTRRQA